MKISQLSNCLKRDLRILLTQPPQTKEITAYRIETVALNVIGALGFFVSLRGVAIYTGLFLLAPGLSPLLSCAGSALGIALSHDLMQIGVNRSEILKAFHPPQTFKEFLTQTAHNVKIAGQAIHGMFKNEPLEIRNTWILLPLYKMLNQR